MLQLFHFEHMEEVLITDNNHYVVKLIHSVHIEHNLLLQLEDVDAETSRLLLKSLHIAE